MGAAFHKFSSRGEGVEGGERLSCRAIIIASREVSRVTAPSLSFHSLALSLQHTFPIPFPSRSPPPALSPSPSPIPTPFSFSTKSRDLINPFSTFIQIAEFRDAGAARCLTGRVNNATRGFVSEGSWREGGVPLPSHCNTMPLILRPISANENNTVILDENEWMAKGKGVSSNGGGGRRGRHLRTGWGREDAAWSRIANSICISWSSAEMLDTQWNKRG